MTFMRRTIEHLLSLYSYHNFATQVSALPATPPQTCYCSQSWSGDHSGRIKLIVIGDIWGLSGPNTNCLSLLLRMHYLIMC